MWRTIDLSLCSISYDSREQSKEDVKKGFVSRGARAIKQGVEFYCTHQRMWGWALRKEEPQSSSGAARTIRKGQEARPLGRGRVIISQTQLSAPNFTFNPLLFTSAYYAICFGNLSRAWMNWRKVYIVCSWRSEFWLNRLRKLLNCSSPNKYQPRAYSENWF